MKAVFYLKAVKTAINLLMLTRSRSIIELPERTEGNPGNPGPNPWRIAPSKEIEALVYRELAKEDQPRHPAEPKREVKRAIAEGKPTPIKPEKTKEPWQMTFREWRIGREELEPKVNLFGVHKGIVKSALFEGKSVPAEVLKDYPDLAKQAKPAAPSIQEMKQALVDYWRSQGITRELKLSESAIRDEYKTLELTGKLPVVPEATKIEQLEVMRADPAGTAVKNKVSGEIYWYDKSHGGWTIYGTTKPVPTDLVPLLEQSVAGFRLPKLALPKAEAVTPEVRTLTDAEIQQRVGAVGFEIKPTQGGYGFFDKQGKLVHWERDMAGVEAMLLTEKEVKKLQAPIIESIVGKKKPVINAEDRAFFQKIVSDLADAKTPDAVARYYPQLIMGEKGDYFQQLIKRYNLPTDILKLHERIKKLVAKPEALAVPARVADITAELTIGERTAILNKYRTSPEGSALYEKWRKTQDQFGAGSEEALLLQDQIVAAENQLAISLGVATPKPAVALEVAKEITNFTWQKGDRPYKWRFGASYNLIHKPTGQVVTDKLKSVEMAKAMARELESVADWSFTNPEDIAKIDFRLYRPIMNKYKPEFIGGRKTKEWEYTHLGEPKAVIPKATGEITQPVITIGDVITTELQPLGAPPTIGQVIGEGIIGKGATRSPAWTIRTSPGPKGVTAIPKDAAKVLAKMPTKAEAVAPEVIKPEIELATKKIEQVIRNMARRKYQRLVDDYANVGVELFDERQFARDLGITPDDLETIIPIKRKTSVFGGKGIMFRPSDSEMKTAIPKLANYIRKSQVAIPQAKASNPRGIVEDITYATRETKSKEEDERGKGCIQCSINHLSTCSGLLSESLRFARSKDLGVKDVTERLGLCQDELNAMERVDLRAEKVVELEPQEKQIADDILTSSRLLRHALENINEVSELEDLTAQMQKLRTAISDKYYAMRRSRLKTGGKANPSNPATPEVTADDWANMTAAQRIALVRSKGLEGSVGLVNWEGLTSKERSILTGKPEISIPTEMIPEVWAKGILAIEELGKESMAVSTPKPSAKAIREAHRILGDIPARTQMPQSIRDYIKRIKNVAKKQYAKDYADWVLRGKVGKAPISKLGTMAEQSVKWGIEKMLPVKAPFISEVVSTPWQPKTYIFRVEPEPLLPGGKKYVAYYADGTPKYLSAATEAELKTRIRQVEPNAIFRGATEVATSKTKGG